MIPTYTTPDNRIDPVAVKQATINLIRRKPWLHAGETYDSFLRAAEAEQQTRAFFAAHDAQAAVEARKVEEAAQHLARTNGYDVGWIQFQRDRWFFGNATNRVRELPKWDRALTIAREHQRERADA